MTNYLNEEDEEDKYSSEEKISDDVPQVEVDDNDNDDNEWGSDEDDDDWGNERVEGEGDEISDTVEEPTEDSGDEISDSMPEPSTEEINSNPSSDQPQGFKVLSFEDFISNK